MAKIFYDNDADTSELKNLTCAVIGYGNQGRAHALNLRDSGIKVLVCARRDGKGHEQAIKDGFEPGDIGKTISQCQLIATLLPDQVVANIFNNEILPNLKHPMAFVFAHGFVVREKLIKLPADADILLVAPTGPGRLLRSFYQEGKGLPALIAIEQDGSGHAFARCLAYARAIGSTRAGAILTTFAEETITDLFCEQAVLCGGLPELIKASFNTLVEAGYQPELAYISCLKEVKLIADLLFESGLAGMRQAISDTAQFGGAKTGPRLIDGHVKEKLTETLTRIESGQFAKEYLAQAKKDQNFLQEFLDRERHSPLGKIEKQLRKTLHF
jgi:ketol-acid reductoisomerase